MTIAVIGGTGFIGSQVVRRLLAHGEDVVVVHRGKHPSALPPQAVSRVADRTDVAALRAVLAETRPSAVVDIYALTQRNTRPVLDAVAGTGARYVLISSADVYANYGGLVRREQPAPVREPMAEDAPLRSTRYPFSSSDPTIPPDDFRNTYDKIVVEEAATGDGRFEVTILRLPMVYGPGDRQHRFRAMVEAIDAGGAVRLNGQAAQWRSTYGFVTDVGEAIALAALRPEAAGRTYNIGAERGASQVDLYERAAAAAGSGAMIEIVQQGGLLADFSAGADVDYPLVLDTGRIRAELGFAEIVGEDEAMRQTMAYERGPG